MLGLRTEPKELDVLLERVEELDESRIESLRTLEEHAGSSGFASALEWLEAIEEVHGPIDGLDELAVYRCSRFESSRTEQLELGD